jgi:hypothetical protein
MLRPGHRLAGAALAAVLSACGGSLGLKKAEQGLAGTFITYGTAAQLADCSALKTQFQKDSCRHDNERVVEMPYQGMLLIRNLDTRRTLEQPLDERGAFRTILDPGNYEVCVNEECSDPIEVRRNEFAIYGQRLPRPAAGEPSAIGKGPADAAATLKHP